MSKRFLRTLSLTMIFGICASFRSFSQSSEQITKILDSQKASLAQVSYLPALYKNLITENDSEQKAFDSLQEAGIILDGENADSEANLAQVSRILLKSLGIKGGVFYTLFGSDRYAFKELKARGVFPLSADPSTKISGRDFMDIFNSTLELTGE